MQYVAFLRGINVGSKNRVPMEDLRKLFSVMAFTNIVTLLNTGNVLFSTNESDVMRLQNKVSEQLQTRYGWEIPVHIRPLQTITQMVFANPFKHITLTPLTRCYVTFLMHQKQRHLFENSHQNFKIIHVTPDTIFSVVVLSDTFKTTEAMAILDKEYGKNVTTRNWQTIIKLANLSPHE